MKTIITIGIIVLIIGMFIGGYFTYPQFNPCPEITTDTIKFYDTITFHHIPDSFPYYVESKPIIIHDTIYPKIDSSIVYKDYFDLHIYDRKWENDSMEINLRDTLSQNKYRGNYFTYRQKYPTSTVNNNVDNSIRYDKYLQLGIAVPIKDWKYSQVELNYIFPKGSLGGFYQPEIKSFGVKASTTILKIKGK